MGSKSNGSTSSSSSSSSSSGRKRPYGLLLLLALGAAVLSVVILQKLRERRVFGLLLEDRDHQLLHLHLLLQKERENSKELKAKMEEMKAKFASLRSKKMELDRDLLEAQNTVAYMKEVQREMELAQEEKQTKIKKLDGMEAESINARLQVEDLKSLLSTREAEAEEMKKRIETLSSSSKQEDATVVVENVVVNEAAVTRGDEKRPLVHQSRTN